MPYIEPRDIQEHLRIGGRVSIPAITELMREVESYVKMHLNLDPLPENVDVLRSIIRELTMSKVIMDSLQPNSEDLARAQTHNAIGMRMLREVKDEGLVPADIGSRNVANEVYNPDPFPFFNIGDFQP